MSSDDLINRLKQARHKAQANRDMENLNARDAKVSANIHQEYAYQFEDLLTFIEKQAKAETATQAMKGVE